MIKVFQANLNALQHYRVAPIRSKIVLFQAGNLRARSTISKLSTRFALSSVVRFWDRHSAGGCELIKVPGDHMSIMSPPAIGVISERVREAIAGDTRYVASA
jgi:phthiocerol/phenolphthiocerol synthesis type-I polyketide synthase D